MKQMKQQQEKGTKTNKCENTDNQQQPLALPFYFTDWPAVGIIQATPIKRVNFYPSYQ